MSDEQRYVRTGGVTRPMWDRQGMVPLTAVEYQALTIAAGESSLSLSGYLRQALGLPLRIEEALAQEKGGQDELGDVGANDRGGE